MPRRAYVVDDVTERVRLMIKAHKELDIGDEIDPVTYEITQEKINIYSSHVYCHVL